MTAELATMFCWLGLISVAAFSDWRHFRIPNICPILLILLFPISKAYIGLDAGWLSNLGHFGIALLAGIILFGLGWIGGGDAKLYAAIALWFDLQQAISLLLAVVLLGGVLAVCYLATRKYRRRRKAASAKQKGSVQETRIPYGVAITLGAIYTCLLYTSDAADE